EIRVNRANKSRMVNITSSVNSLQRSGINTILLFIDPPSTMIYTLSLHDALPISCLQWSSPAWTMAARDQWIGWNSQERARNLQRSEEHTSELQSPYDLVCRPLPEKKKVLTVGRGVALTPSFMNLIHCSP